MATKYICDICGGPMIRWEAGILGGTMQSPHITCHLGSSNQALDVCDPCFNKFKEWVKSASSSEGA